MTAHAEEGRGARLALDVRVDELAHMPCYATARALLRELARRRVPIVGTLHVEEGCPDRDPNARTFVAAGGKLLYGSDSAAPGIDVEELRLMIAAGLTPTEAITAGTAEAGARLGLAPLGTLVAGAPADVIAVRGDPRTRLDILDNPILVVAGGRVVVTETRLHFPVP